MTTKKDEVSQVKVDKPKEKPAKAEKIPTVHEVEEVGGVAHTADRNEEVPPLKAPEEAVLYPVDAPNVRTSWDEQRDLATHDAQAAESQKDLAERDALKAAQDEQYLKGSNA